MITHTPATKLCTQCLQRKPLTEFRRATNPRYPAAECRTCHNELECVRAARKRQRHREAVISDYVLRMKNARTNHRVAWLCSELIDHFGGPAQLLKAWTRQIDRLRQEQPSGKKILDFYRTLVRLLEVSDAQRADTVQMSDEELGDALLDHAKRLIAEEPEMVVLAAQATGWQVSPPGDGQ